MTNLLLNREIPREPNYSVLYAAYIVLRRQPWQMWAGRTWNAMKSCLLAALLAACAGATAHARNYEVLTADVPFKFNIGNRTFGPGQYQFIFAGNGLLAVRDANAHMVASLVTRSVASGAPSVETKLVFKLRKNQQRLEQLRIANSTQVVEIVREEEAAPAYPTALSPALPNTFHFSGPRLRD
jgi:hypothetical protein